MQWLSADDGAWFGVSWNGRQSSENASQQVWKIWVYIYKCSYTREQLGDAKIIEGKRERIQAFEGVVVSRKGGSVSETFTVRKISSGVGVERIFPVHSPKIAGITVVRHGKVRRAKLTFLKDRVGGYRIKEKGQK